MKKPCETKVSQGFFLSRRFSTKTEMHRRPAGWSIDMKMDLGLRLVAAPGTCAMAKQEIDQVAGLMPGSVEPNVGNFHCRFVDWMKHRRRLASAFGGDVQVVFIDCHL